MYIAIVLRVKVLDRKCLSYDERLSACHWCQQTLSLSKNFSEELLSEDNLSGVMKLQLENDRFVLTSSSYRHFLLRLLHQSIYEIWCRSENLQSMSIVAMIFSMEDSGVQFIIPFSKRQSHNACNEYTTVFNI
ncbi:hypothetical protein M758_5G040300 [Ceratodon purpureus]|nr:hypothetical protein M758_5G040300 [Ceratodon purpureus]